MWYDDEEDTFDGSTEETVRRFERYLADRKHNNGYFDVEELTAVADYYLDATDVKSANIAIEIGLNLHPDNSALLLRNAFTMLFSGDLGKAIAITDHIPENTDLFLWNRVRFEACLRLNRKNEAVAVADKLLQQSEDMDEGPLQIAHLFMTQGCYAEACDFLEKAFAKYPKDIDLLIEKAICQEHMGHWTLAVETYNRILDQDPYSAEAWFNLGQLYYAHEHYRQAVQAYDYCTAINPKDGPCWMQLGHAYFQLGKMQQAANCYQNSIDVYKSTDTATHLQWMPYFESIEQLYCFLGECYERMEQYDVAERNYHLALESRPNYYGALIGLGVCSLDNEKYAEAIDLMQTAINTMQGTETCYDAYAYLGDAYSELNQVEDALAAYQKSLKIEPDQADTCDSMANLLFDLERYEEAIEYYQQSYKIDSTHSHVLIFLAAACFHLKRYEEMFDYLDEAMKHVPDTADYFFRLCPEAADFIQELLKKKNPNKGEQ